MKYIERNKNIREENHSKIICDLLNKSDRYKIIDRLPSGVVAYENEIRELIQVLGTYIEEQERKNDYLLEKLAECIEGQRFIRNTNKQIMEFLEKKLYKF
jgi:hypothetical protein